MDPYPINLSITIPTGADGSEPADEFHAKPELAGMAKFLTVHEGVTLVRFHGRDEIKLVARRVGRSGNPNTLFEISVDKAGRLASVAKDGKILFEIKGLNIGYSHIEKIAVSALHRYLKDQRPSNSKRRRAKRLREKAAE